MSGVMGLSGKVKKSPFFQLSIISDSRSHTLVIVFLLMSNIVMFMSKRMSESHT